MKLDDRGRPIEDERSRTLGENVLIVDPVEAAAAINRAPLSCEQEASPKNNG